MDYTANILLRNTIELLSGHEFRTPIHGIVGFSEFLQNEDFNLNEEEKKEFAKNINISAKRLMNLSERLNLWHSLFTNYSITKKTKFELSSQSIESLILAEADTYLIPGELIRFSTNMENCVVFGARKTFEIAISELIQNAFKFSAKDTVVSFSLIKSGDEVLAQISNTSASATVDELMTYTVFTQFHRKKNEQQGLGLGMEIARLGITQCGGKIKLRRDMAGENNDQVVFEVSLRKEFFA